MPGGTISTIAGGVGGPGLARSVALSPCGLKTAGAYLYIGTGAALRRVNITTGELTTVAGNNAAGPAGNGGAATATALGSACGSAVDPAGNLAIADSQMVKLAAAKTGTFYGQRMTAGHIYTVAGNPTTQRGLEQNCSCFVPDGDGGPATRAALGTAGDVTFDRAGNMLIADTGQSAGYGPCGDDCPAVGALLRVVAAKTGTFYDVKMKAGDIYTIAGQQSGPDPEGDGGLAVRSWLGPWLCSAEPDRAGNIILAGEDEPVFVPDGQIVLTPFVRVIAKVTGTFYGQKMKAGHIYHVAGEVNPGPYRTPSRAPGRRCGRLAAPSRILLATW